MFTLRLLVRVNALTGPLLIVVWILNVSAASLQHPILLRFDSPTLLVGYYSQQSRSIGLMRSRCSFWSLCVYLRAEYLKSFDTSPSHARQKAVQPRFATFDTSTYQDQIINRVYNSSPPQYPRWHGLHRKIFALAYLYVILYRPILCE